MNKKIDFNIEKEIANNDAEKIFKLHKLYKSYNAYINLLAKYHNEYLEVDNDLLEVCYKDQDEYLFSSFKSGEYLICEQLRRFVGNDKIFLLPDKDRLLIIESCLDWESKLKEYFIKSSIIKIGKHCKGKIFTEEVSHFSSSDGWDYDDRLAFAFFDEDKPYNKQITFTYSLTDELKNYDGVDIRDILTPMSLEEIIYRLKMKVEEKTKRLTLHH